VEVKLPDGTRVTAHSIFERQEDDPWREFGLYMDERWKPTWRAEVIDWEDFGVPASPETAAKQISDTFARAKEGQKVEVGCLGGLGRTGTVLACMAVLAGAPPAEAVAWVRRNYNKAAIETTEQEKWVHWFAHQSQAGDSN
jgi:protein-tyrosine phosphatase